ncbi:MAG: carbohydrate ABC transporter permease [Lachnospiraceae bacterium]|nr:carbohydrate ABC transporter permease [Lachnospiraceae bacterium]
MRNTSLLKKGNRYKIGIHIFFILFSLLFILPMIMVVSVSFSSEDAVTSTFGGYSLLPREFTLDAYKLAFKNPETVINGYIVTIITSIAGTLLNLMSAGMCAYALARPNFRYKKIVTFIVFFTMLFGGGTIPTYIIYTKYYHLGNTIWVYILPALSGGAWNILMIRTFMQSLPESLFESAKIDGAAELTIFWKIGLPLSKPVFATVAFTGLIGRWNDWSTSLVYIRDSRLYTLQYSLQKILNEAEFLKALVKNPLFQNAGIDISEVAAEPTETLKYAMCVIAAGPMLVIFPFFQKYFEKGMVVGAVKG